MSMLTNYDEESIAAGTAAATAAIDDFSTQPPVRFLSLAGGNDAAGRMNLSSVLEEAQEQGDGGDSNVEADDAQDYDGAVNDCLLVDNDVQSLPVVSHCQLLLQH
jgi:hypothetical protein